MLEFYGILNKNFEELYFEGLFEMCFGQGGGSETGDLFGKLFALGLCCLAYLG
jgi:hypothetical protein